MDTLEDTRQIWIHAGNRQCSIIYPSPSINSLIHAIQDAGSLTLIQSFFHSVTRRFRMRRVIHRIFRLFTIGSCRATTAAPQGSLESTADRNNPTDQEEDETDEQQDAGDVAKELCHSHRLVVNEVVGRPALHLHRDESDAQIAAHDENQPEQVDKGRHFGAHQHDFRERKDQIGPVARDGIPDRFRAIGALGTANEGPVCWHHDKGKDDDGGVKEGIQCPADSRLSIEIEDSGPSRHYTVLDMSLCLHGKVDGVTDRQHKIDRHGPKGDI